MDDKQYCESDEQGEFEHVPRSSVISRAAIIMNAFLEGPHRLLLSDLTEVTGLPRSTVFRIISQLVGVGWLERDEDQQGYRLGKRMQTATQPYSRYADLRESSHSTLMRLHRNTNWLVHLSILEDDGLTHFIDRVGVLNELEFPSRVGLRYPFERTAAGKSIVAAMSGREAAKMVQIREDADNISLDDFRQEMTVIRRNYGLATRLGKSGRRNVTAMAAPIIGPDGPVGAISLSGLETQQPNFVPQVLAAAREISMFLHNQADVSDEADVRQVA